MLIQSNLKFLNWQKEQEERAELRRAIFRVLTRRSANLLLRLDVNQPTILWKFNRIENKVDQLLERLR